MLHVLKKHEF